MTPDEAIQRLRTLNAQARQGWPQGYHPGAVLTQAYEAIDVLAGAVAQAPEAGQQALARTFVKRLGAHEATVPPRKGLDVKSTGEVS